MVPPLAFALRAIRPPAPSPGASDLVVERAPRWSSRASASATCSSAVPERTLRTRSWCSARVRPTLSRASVLPPWSSAQVAGGHHTDLLGRHFGPERRRDLAGLTEAFCHRK